VPVQESASRLFAHLTACDGQDLVPGSTVLLMAEQALDALEADPGRAPPPAGCSNVLLYTTAALAQSSVWQQLDAEKVWTLSVRAVEYFGTPPHCACMSAIWADHARMSVIVPTAVFRLADSTQALSPVDELQARLGDWHCY
jgi:hypothetical protein